MALQTITLFDSEPQFKKFLSDEIGCSDKVIKSLNEYQDLTLAEELYDIDTDDWETIGKQAVSSATNRKACYHSSYHYEETKGGIYGRKVFHMVSIPVDGREYDLG